MDQLHLERAALACLLWGSQEQFDALLDEVDIDHFIRPEVQWIVGLIIAEGDMACWLATEPRAIVLLREIHDQAQAGQQLMTEVTEQVTYWIPPHEREGLAFYLGRLAEAHERRQVEAELVRLADTLHRPGGVDRVRARLAGVA